MAPSSCMIWSCSQSVNSRLMPPALENGVRGWLRSDEWKPEVGALHVADITFGLAMAALDPAHPGDQLLKRVELVGGLAGMRVTSLAFARDGRGDIDVVGWREVHGVLTVGDFVVVEREALAHLQPGVIREHGDGAV